MNTNQRTLKTRFTLLAVAILLAASLANAQRADLVIAHNGNSPALHAAIAHYIGSTLNLRVQVLEIPKVTDFVATFKRGGIDISFLGAFEYVLVRDELKDALEPFVVFGHNGVPGSYTSSLITLPNAEPRNLDQLKQNTKNFRLVFSTPSSTSGHILPRLYMKSLGIDNPEGGFKSVTFAGGHDEVIQQLVDKKADVGAIATGYLQSWTAAGKLQANQIQILWTSGPIAEGPVVVRRQLNSTVKESIRTLFLELPQKNPSLWKEIQTTYPGAKQGYITCKDEFYNPIRQLAHQIEHLRTILRYYFTKNF